VSRTCTASLSPAERPLSETIERSLVEVFYLQAGLKGLSFFSGVRRNSLDAAAWHQVMDRLETVTSITSLNGLDGIGGLFAGSQPEVQLGGKGLAEKEAVVAVVRLLGRSRATLTRLDLRCCAGL
jgi:hypothetical protein